MPKSENKMIRKDFNVKMFLKSVYPKCGGLNYCHDNIAPHDGAKNERKCNKMSREEKIAKLQEDLTEEKKRADEKLEKINAKLKVEELKTEKKLTKLENQRDVEMKKTQLESAKIQNDTRIEQKAQEKDTAKDIRQNIR